MNERITSTLRLRIGQEDAHYGGSLVAGARTIELFGDVATEIAIAIDGDEGLFVGYESIEFLAPLYAGDFLEVTGSVVKVGRTSRRIEFEARKVIASRYDLSASAADVLHDPITTCRAIGTTVVPREHSRAPSADVAAEFTESSKIPSTGEMVDERPA